MHPVIVSLRSRIGAASEALRGPQLPVLGLALALALLWFGAQALWLALPLLLLVAALPWSARPAARWTGAPDQPAEMARALARQRAGAPGSDTAFILLALHGIAEIRARHGPGMEDRLVTTCLDHLARALRREDGLYDLGGGRIGVVPAAGNMEGDELVGVLAERLRRAAGTALASALPDTPIRVSLVAEVIRAGARQGTGDLVTAGLARLDRTPAPLEAADVPRPASGFRTRAQPPAGPAG